MLVLTILVLPPSTSLELVTDGDLLILIRRMIDLRGGNTGSCYLGLKVMLMRVWLLTVVFVSLIVLVTMLLMRPADFGRGRVSPAVIDARRYLSGVCGRWYPVILDLHRFFITISRAVVNHDGYDGTAPDPMVWSGLFMLFVILLCFLGLLLFGLVSGLLVLLVLFVLMMLLSGLTLLVF